MERQLDHIITQLKELGTADRELTHQIADELLLQALSLIADNNGLSERIDTLIEHYHSIPKWFCKG